MEKKFRFAWLAFFVASAIHIQAQDRVVTLNRDVNNRYEPYLEQLDAHSHTSFKPYSADELRGSIPYDSINAPHLNDCKFYNTWLGRKLRKEHLFSVDENDFKLDVDPVFDVSVGVDQNDKQKVYTSTRGFLLEGNIGTQLSFYTAFYENQGTFLKYIDSTIRVQPQPGAPFIIPGQGKAKIFNNGFDYFYSLGGISYTPSKYFNFQLASDKNFIGDGYRSLLLSDNAFSYPFFKITTTVWKIKYTNLYGFFLDPMSTHDPDVGFRKKYGSFHYLDMNIGKRERLSVGLFESVIWKSDSTGMRGYDISYLNPIIFYRPIEESLDSPDNAFLGLNVKYKVCNSFTVYSQLLLDEFKLSHIKAGDGWWANKQAVQGGFKYFNAGGLKHLNIQSEINFVRPFTYQHRSTLQNYSHYNEALAHPLGANFYESVSFISYQIKNLFIELKFNYAIAGKDTAGLNYGGNISLPYESYVKEYGNKVGQGLRTKIVDKDIRISYLVNPATNFNIELGVSGRSYGNSMNKSESMFVYFGVRTSLTNHYYDF